MFIQTQATENPDCLKFLPGREVTDGRTIEFRNPAEAGASPLAQRLFAVESVARVALGAEHSSDPWRALEVGIHETLSASLAADVQQILLRDAPNVLGAEAWRQLEDQYSFGLMRGAVAGLMEVGPVLPWQPPRLLRLTTKKRLVSIGLPGPMQMSHQPGFASSGEW